MLDILSEAVLQQYFVYNAIVGSHVDDRTLFNLVADKFLLSAEEADGLFALAQREAVRDIVTPSDAKRYSRVRQYNVMYGSEEADPELHTAVTLKSSAIALAYKQELLPARGATAMMVYNVLWDKAATGNTLAMRLLGTLQCEGLLVQRDTSAGLKLLERTSQWADMVGTLSLLSYVEGDAFNAAFARLAACLEGTAYRSLLDRAAARYGTPIPRPCPETVLLQKVLASRRFSPDEYNAMVARLLFSDALTLADKEKVLFSENKQLLSDVCNLPLRLDHAAIDPALFKLPFFRAEECAAMENVLRNADLRVNANYTPLCLRSKSEYVRTAYIAALCGMAGDNLNVECINVAELSEYDLGPNAGNILVRSARHGQNNVYVLVLQGDIQEGAVDTVAAFLDTVKRRRMHLANLGITLNLDAVLPVCVCDDSNAAKLKELVHTLRPAEMTTQEKHALLRRIVQSKSMLYLNRDVEAEEAALDELCAYSPAVAENILDKVFADNRFESRFDCVTAEAIRSCVGLFDDAKAHGGFWRVM